MFDSLTSMDRSIRDESNELSKRGIGILNRIAKQQWASYYGIQGDYLQAANYLQEVILGDQDLDADNQAEIFGSLGMCFMRIGQVDRAIEAYQNALALTPSADEMRRGLVDALVSSNRFKEALDEFGQISDSVAKDYLRACEVMLSMQSSGSQDTALWDRFDEAFKKALELSPSDPFL
ncbi:MAG: tetratricopeptide repeat protein, partial [Pirellula sp.]